MKRSLPHNIPASGTYETTDRLTKVRCAAPTFEGLLDRINHVRTAMGAVSGLDLRTEVENWICEEHPEDCTEVDMNIPRKRHLTLSDVIRGTRVMASFKLAGSPLVERTEAERRGAICQHCDFNQWFAKPCTGICPELQTVVNNIVGHQGTHYDQYLNSCGICSCFLQASIWLPLWIQDKGLTDEMREQFKKVVVTMPTGHSIPCWKNYQSCDTIKDNLCSTATAH
jgi:hypothetical protein